jgi:tetratricopeptide (TPR) repeat protein
MPAHASAAQCKFPRSTKTSVDELVASIKREFRCGLPYAAVKTAVSSPDGLMKLRAAYQAALSRHPDQAHYVMGMSHIVEAAAGQPEAMLADSEANIAAHPEDKTLLNAACWVRGGHGVDLDHAMPYCDGAVAAGRPSYALANRGLVELQLGNFRAALHDYNEALADKNYVKDAYCAHAIYGRGVARLRLGDAGGADDLKYAQTLSYSASEEFEGVGLKP